MTRRPLFDPMGNYLAAVFAVVTLSGVAVVIALSHADERGRWLARGCDTDIDCQRMAEYLCSTGAVDACEEMP